MPQLLDRQNPSRRRLLTAALVCAAVVSAALLGGPPTRAQTSLDSVRAKQDQIRDQLADENAAVDAALAEAGRLRAAEKDIEAELADKQAELDAAREDLARQRAQLAQTKRKLHAASGVLERLLVSIYMHGEIDEMQVLLDADGLDDLASRAEFLGKVEDYQAGVVGRVRTLREDLAETVGSSEDTVARIGAARDAIENRRQRLEAASAEAAQRRDDLLALRADRREALAGLIGKEKNLVEALSEPTESTGPSKPVAPPSGARATLNPDGTANAPADAPAAVKAAIEAGNRIVNTPYIYGGGHGSFEASGYDCSGSVSYLLHGGGFLDSPLDSTGLMTWGDAGPGSWITVYANPGHTYAIVAGLRYDTSGAPPRWQSAPRSSAGFVVRHPAGY